MNADEYLALVVLILVMGLIQGVVFYLTNKRGEE